MKTLKILGIFCFFLWPLLVSAQVVIGSDKLPEKFSVLELISDSQDPKGLLCPQSAVAPTISGASNPDANGLIYYDTVIQNLMVYIDGNWYRLYEPIPQPSSPMPGNKKFPGNQQIRLGETNGDSSQPGQQAGGKKK
jgi:hypothetical protein